MENFYKLVDTKVASYNPNLHKSHEIELPFRALIIGASGTGKSNTLLNLIKALSRPKPTLNHIYLFCKSADEPLYAYLKKKLKDDLTIKEDGEIIPLEDIEKDGEQLVIFDDLVNDKNATALAIEYYKMARKKNISCVYLSQSYYRVDKFIRSNCSHLIIKKVPSVRDLRMILSEYPLTLSIDDLKRIYNQATKRFEDVLLMDLINGHMFHNFKMLII
jgi:Cdc6-like AAA superfamily ATPase